MRIALLIALIAAGALVAYLLFADEGLIGDGGVDGVQTESEDDLTNPALHGSSDRHDKRTASPTQESPESKEEPTHDALPEQGHALSGRVVDAATGNPVAGAMVWGERAKTPCPRLPERGYVDIGVPGTSHVNARTHTPLRPPQGIRINAIGGPAALTSHQARSNERGEFRIKRMRSAGNRFDVFALAKGFVCGCTCAVDGGAPIVIELRRGVTVSGHVRSTSTQPIEGASVQFTPAEGTRRELGHFGNDISNKRGEYAVGGLRTAPMNVTIDHPTHMPATLGPLTPKEDTTYDVVLTPALLLRLNVRSGDGRPLEDILVQWVMTADASQQAASIVSIDPGATGKLHGDEGSTSLRMDHVVTRPIRIPSGYGDAVVRVSAKGYSEWRSEPIKVPERGGEQTVDVTLNRDTGAGTARFSFFKEDGTQVAFTSLGAKLSIGRTDASAAGEEGSAMTARYTQDLTLVGVGEGTYRLIVRSPEYAPAEVDFQASASSSVSPQRITLEPAAKIRITFAATETTTVTFQLTHDGEIAKGIPIGGREVADEEAGTGRTMAVFGSDSALFGGLAPGRYTIEVVSSDLHATPRTVELRAGETTDVEIPVTRR